MRSFAAGALGALASVAAALAAPAARADVAELRDQGIRLAIDRNDVAVSGISSGAAMAFQLHVARSKDLTGAGLVAGPPFRCADYMLGQMPPVSAALTAVNLCTAYYRKLPPAFTVPGVAGVTPELSRLVLLAKDAFDRKKVDPVSGLCGDRVFLIAGAADDTVPGPVTNATEKLYATLMESCETGPTGTPNLVSKTVVGMPHTMPTDRSPDGTACSAGAPYIANCGMTGAADMLGFLHRRENAPQANRPADPKNLVRFDQHRVIGATEPKGMMHQFGYVYVPEACRTGASCALHIALHGCHQNEDMINEGSYDPRHKYLFAADAGYNDFAERNNIVILYPQAAASSAMGGNPNGCWDWFGYNGPDYWQKDSRQMRNVWKLVEALR
ncbi:hypothetical protein [Azospirillum sp. SYSU D00513]|uniref:hypothetical protein n=1 Tax=Azospirillum sp. SYSU D00513 TaxID=2812561 RepID=UPI001A976408|nr:hypothetical protein [Azospirillum sp. SYSU D00513]